MKPNATALPEIHPLLGDKAPRWTDETQTKCGCDLCQHWLPLIAHIRAQLNEEGNHLLNELVDQWMNDAMDKDVAEAKLNGTWPGYEHIKESFTPNIENEPIIFKQ